MPRLPWPLSDKVYLTKDGYPLGVLPGLDPSLGVVPWLLCVLREQQSVSLTVTSQTVSVDLCGYVQRAHVG